jgi:predicted enzyme related to lactoylglutathione lyase
MGPEMIYTIFKLGDRDVAGAYTLMKEQVDAHVPPHWLLYVKVDSADASAAKAAALGGKTLMPPGDVPNVGRIAVMQDSTGAAIGLFQPGQHRGFENFGEVGALCWADLNSTNPDAAAEFYGGLFGWTFEAGDEGYRHIVNGSGHENMIGGLPSRMHAPPGTPSHWMPYYRAADCAASCRMAAQLGAKTLMPATPMPKVGTIAVLADPQGGAFSLFQSML